MTCSLSLNIVSRRNPLLHGVEIALCRILTLCCEYRFFYVNASYSIVVCSCDSNKAYSQKGLLVGHTHSVEQLVFHPRTGYLASCGEDGIFVWNVETFEIIQHFA